MTKSIMLLFLAALALPLPSQQLLAAQDLGLPVVSWEKDFSRIASLAELPDGRVLVVDNLDELLFLGDATGSSVTQLGRAGDGPNEYRRPWSVTRGRNDTLLVYSQNRLVTIAPTGTIAASNIHSGAQLGGTVGPLRGIDRQGRVYWDRAVIRDPSSGAIKRQQQYEIVRVLPGQTEVEVVARASDHAPELHEMRFHPFAERDAWVIEPDGAVRVMRAKNLSVDLLREGRIVESSAPIAFDRAPITRQDREAYRASRAANQSGVSFGGQAAVSRGGVTSERMEQMRRAYPDEMFPNSKPPFVEDGLYRSPGGDLWVVLSPEGATTANRIVVLDQSGQRRAEFTLPPARELRGLDRRGIYLVHEDDDGLQFLERYAWPDGHR